MSPISSVRSYSTFASDVSLGSSVILSPTSATSNSPVIIIASSTRNSPSTVDSNDRISTSTSPKSSPNSTVPSFARLRCTRSLPARCQTARHPPVKHLEGAYRPLGNEVKRFPSQILSTVPPIIAFLKPAVTSPSGLTESQPTYSKSILPWSGCIHRSYPRLSVPRLSLSSSSAVSRQPETRLVDVVAIVPTTPSTPRRFTPILIRPALSYKTVGYCLRCWGENV